jgi:flagellar hook assembly protein FlgD
VVKKIKGEQKMKQRKFLVVLLALVMVLCVCAVVACTVKEQAKATGVTLDVGKLGTLQEGATLDVSKLKITVSYSDKTQKDIAAGDVTLTLDGKAYNKEPLTEGEHTVKVSYVPAENADPLTAEAKITVSHVHNYGEVHKGTPATCMTAGTKDYYECACGKKFVKDGDNYVETTDLTIAIDANAHDFEGQPYVDGGAEGHYQQCKLNGEHHSATEAHAGGTATCQKLAKCSKCNAEYGTLADHVYGNIVPAKDATIDEAGNVEYKDCNVCKKHFDNDGKEIADVTIPKLEAVTIKFVGIDRADIRIAKGTTTTIEEPVLADNVFINWTDAKGEVVDVTAAFNADITLTANFKEGYNFKKNHINAAATTTTANAEAGTVSIDGNFETGIRYQLPTKDALYNITLPCVNYSKFTVVLFKWKSAAWTQTGIDGARNHSGNDQEGIIEVVNENGTYRIIWMDVANKDIYWSRTISDNEVINGTKGLGIIEANTFSDGRWLDIEVSAVSHVYNDGVLQRVAVKDGNEMFRESYGSYDPNENRGNWTVALQAIDYTKHTSVTFNWNFNNPWARIGLNRADEMFDSGAAMSGKLVIAKNAEGKYVATLTNTAGGICTKVLADDVANGTKGLVLFFGSDEPYRTFVIDAIPTFA